MKGGFIESLTMSTKGVKVTLTPKHDSNRLINEGKKNRNICLGDLKHSGKRSR